jgi:enterochelin esterase-like enzyme
MALPGFTPLGSAPNGGQLLQGTFPGTVRPGYVYLPPNFDTGTRYPVVYLLHGLPGSPAEYVNAVDVAGFADRGIAAGTLKPFIAVMPAAGPAPKYNGEWAGVWEHAVVDRIVPWVDEWLPTIAAPSGRVIAGLSAGGFGAFDIALRHPQLFGAVESWSGYFTPLHDGPFRDAGPTTLAANNPTILARSEASTLRAAHTRFFVSTGPYHSHWIKRGTTQAFADELRSLRLPVALQVYPDPVGEWQDQVDAGLTWAFEN